MTAITPTVLNDSILQRWLERVRSLSAADAATALTFASIGGVATTKISDPDVFWHLATGRWIWRWHKIPKNDPFSWTAPGRKWIAHEWLTEAMWHPIYVAFGWAGLILLSTLTILATWAIVHRTARRLGATQGMATLAVALGAGSTVHTWGTRPQMFSLLFTSIYLCMAARSEISIRKFVSITSVLMLLWANMHGGYIFGIALLGALAVGSIFDAMFRGPEPRTRWTRLHKSPRVYKFSLATIMAILVCLINPNGIQGLIYPFTYLGDNASTRYIAEWFAPSFTDPQYWPFAVGLILLTVVLVQSRKLFPMSTYLICVPFAALGIQSVRNIGQFAVVTAPWIAVGITTLLARRSAQREASETSVSGTATVSGSTATRAQADEKAKAIVHTVAAVASVVAWAVLAAGNLGATANEAAIAKEYPAEAAKALTTARGGQLFNQYGWGGYLTLRTPQYKVFVDGRPDMYGDPFMDRYMDTWRVKPGWQQRLEEDGVDQVLVEPTSAIGKALANDPKWKVHYEDDLAVLYVLADGA